MEKLMKWFVTRAAIIVALSFCGSVSHAEVLFDWATVGNPGNPADDTIMIHDGTTGYGSVGYTYLISKTEVTNAQYTEFLNAVAATDTYALYQEQMQTSPRGGIVRSGATGSYTYSVKADAIGQGPGGTDYSYANKPVIWVSWYDSIRFVNWMTSGETETGSYTITLSDSDFDVGVGDIPSVESVTIPDTAQRALWADGSTPYFLMASEDEWYKAAYYEPGDKIADTVGSYYSYATKSNILPDNNLPDLDSGNSANYVAVTPSAVYTTGNSDYPQTDAGAYTLSDSPYGTFDQSGSVLEWNESPIDSFGEIHRVFCHGAPKTSQSGAR